MKVSKYLIVIFGLLSSAHLSAQYTVIGNFVAHAGAEIRLKGFDGFEEQVFSQDTLDEMGAFELSYPATYQGMGAVEIKKEGSLLLILSQENINMNSPHIQDYQSLVVENSIENKYFDSYILQQGIRNKKLDGWKWLKPIYEFEDSLSKTLLYINSEIQTLETEEALFLEAIPNNYYASYFLPLRKLIEDRPASVNRYVERIPQHIADFESADLMDVRLWQSGIMQEFYEGHFVMLENRYGIENYEPMYQSIDFIIEELITDEEKLLIVSEYLFKLFEKRSLFPAAEYLSMQMLAQNSCTVDGELERRFEQYRTMKEGNDAPDIIFENTDSTILRGFKNEEKSLKQIESKYKLVAFWASWCEHCMQEMPKLQSMYFKLEEKNVEVISISLDTDRQAFLSASASYPWYSYCDFQEWESAAVEDYYIFATPTFYLLDENNVILKKISSAAQLEAIVNYYLN